MFSGILGCFSASVSVDTYPQPRKLSPVCRPCRPCRQLVDLVDHCRPVVDRELSMCCQLLVDHCRRCRLKIDRYHVCTLSIVVDIVDLSTCRLVDLCRLVCAARVARCPSPRPLPVIVPAYYLCNGAIGIAASKNFPH